MFKLALLWGLTALSFASAVWVDYDRPSIYNKSAHYSLKVNGTYAQTVSYAGYDYVHISMSEGPETEFRIAATSGEKINDPPVISPAKLPIQWRIEGNELIFSLKKVHYLIFKLNKLKEFVVMIDPLEQDAPASKGNGIFNVLDYGADNTGKAITKGIQKALDTAGKKPGSIVYVPAGVYLVGNIIIPTKTSLYLAGGAVLRNTAKKSDYKVMFTKSDLGDGTWWIQTAFDSTDIKIWGRGTIDANGYESIHNKTRADKLIAHVLVPVGTTKFRLDGILVRDASFWAVIPTQTEDVVITNLKILDRLDGVPQNDGIDVVESKNVQVRRVIAIANDDSFSAKTWPKDIGTTVPYPYPPRGLSDVIFDDCLAWTRCYGYKIGQGVYQDQDRVTFKNSVVYYAGVGLGIHHKFGFGTARNIVFENMDLERLQGEPGGTGAWLAIWIQNSNGTGLIRDVTVRNIRARGFGKYGSKIAGFNSSITVENVTLTDIFMLKNTTAAKNIQEMDVKWSDFSKDIKVKNSA